MELIYCVEDDLFIRELIVYTLKLSGFEAEGYNDADGISVNRADWIISFIGYPAILRGFL